MPIRDLNKGIKKKSYLEDQRNFKYLIVTGIITKKFGRPATNFRTAETNKNTWTTRANDWYNGERRIIFATKTDAECQKWMKYFKHLTFKERESERILANNRAANLIY